jgi:Mce-associated membrane protein
MTLNHPERASAPAGWRLPVFGLLVVLLLASATFLGWALVDRRDSYGGGVRLSADQGTGQDDVRDEVRNRTEQFVLRMGTYGPDLLDDKSEMPEYRKRVKELITTKFATSFDEEVTVAEQTVAQVGLVRKAAVFAVGVATLEDDTATALVAGAFTDRFGKGAAGEPRQFRWQVSLVLVDGEWRIDDYVPVTGETP